MKNWKTLVLGFTAGALSMMSVPAVAAAYKNVEAMLIPEAMFKFDDKLIASPSDMPVLNYQGYTYVPIRFVAEQLGCEVSWDVISRQVRVKGPEPEVVERVVEKEVEKIVYVDKESSKQYGDTVYYELPVKYSTKGYNLTLKTVIMDDDDDYSGIRRTRTYLSLDNIDVDKVEIEQIEAKLILDNEEFKMSSRDNMWDDRWDDEFVKKDETLDGFLLFDGIKKDYTTGTLKVPIKVTDDDGYKREVVEINFKH